MELIPFNSLESVSKLAKRAVKITFWRESVRGQMSGILGTFSVWLLLFILLFIVFIVVKSMWN